MGTLKTGECGVHCLDVFDARSIHGCGSYLPIGEMLGGSAPGVMVGAPWPDPTL